MEYIQLGDTRTSQSWTVQNPLALLYIPEDARADYFEEGCEKLVDHDTILLVNPAFMRLWNQDPHAAWGLARTAITDAFFYQSGRDTRPYYDSQMFDHDSLHPELAAWFIDTCSYQHAVHKRAEKSLQQQALQLARDLSQEAQHMVNPKVHIRSFQYTTPNGLQMHIILETPRERVTVRVRGGQTSVDHAQRKRG